MRLIPKNKHRLYDKLISTKKVQRSENRNLNDFDRS